MHATILKNRTKILKAISQLAKGGNKININRVSKITGLDWDTVAKYFKNDFFIEE